MKKLSFLLVFTLLFAAYGSAQNVPRGMKYQAVARDLKGEILANTNIDLKINLVSKKDGNNVMHYSEVHSVTTNQVGLFTLVVGEGKVENGNYEKVPWSNADIWMEIQIKTKGEETFASISNSQLMAVPYAYYSATAGVLVGTKLQETPPKDTTVVQAFGRGEELPESPKCDCDGGLSQVKVLYLGPSAVTINVYKHISCGQQHLITSFTNVNNGAILTINANGNCPGNKLPDNTYLKVVSPGIDLVTLPTSCEDPIVGENFGNFSVLSRKDKNHGTECTVCDIRADWMIGGNGVFDMCNWMGTKTNTDLVLITNNIERLRIMANGDVDLKKNLHVGINLTVDSATNLNSRVGVAGITSLNNTTQSTTPSNGALVVAGGTGIGKNLNVGGNLNVLGTTSVGGPVGFGGAVHITDLTQSTSTTTGALIVDGGAGIAKNVNVGGTLTAAGATTINNTLTLATDNANYAATFQNTNAADGDGIQIKLGKNHPLWNGTSYRQVDLNVLIAPFQPQIDVVRGWVLSGHNVTGSDIISLVESNAALLAGTLCQLTNFLTDQLNTRLGLPFNVAGPVNSALGLPLNLSTPINNALGLPLNIAAPINSGLGLPFDIATPLNNAMGLPYKILDETIIPKIPSFGIPAISSLTIPAIPSSPLTIPSIPSLFLPAIPQINCSGLPSLQIPTLDLTNVANTLTKKNNYLLFADKDDRQVGAIRAQAIEDWKASYLSPTYFLGLAGSMAGLDLTSALGKAGTALVTMSGAYNKIGVEYLSGNGDYAEWLERKDVNEPISVGDIVGVKSGKISKDLIGAEQIMVVSYKPIVLGNVPQAGKEDMGNNVAFMGQIPVKIMGFVLAGDYIVAKGEFPGIGVAVHPEDMTVADFKLVVGRSWDTRLTMGPKLVNTVVGIHNNEFLKFVSELQQKAQTTEYRLRKIEEKLNIKPESPVSKYNRNRKGL